MKSEITPVPPAPASTYPYLAEYIGKDTGMFVVLLTERWKGTVVYAADDSKWKIGDYSSSWANTPEHFRPFTGTIQLSND